MATSTPNTSRMPPVIRTGLGSLATNCTGEAEWQKGPKKCCSSDDNRFQRNSCSSLRKGSEMGCSQGKNKHLKQDCCSGFPEVSGCSGNDTNPCTKLSNTVVVPGSGLCDIEKEITGAEHVVLSVQGLTCVGCENKLFRSLDSIPSVSNLQTSLVFSQAEFDLDMNATSVSNIIRSVERTTGFSCERIISEGQHLDVVVTGDPGDFVNQDHPTGVKDMVLLNRQTVRITYDAKIIGARDLFETSFHTSIQLAPPRPHPALAAGNMHVRKTAYVTLPLRSRYWI
ncbi:MAG: hypothetical protein M1840_001655 [Geoglossum simile]|nr:MAG: hypothetical protein M1840_001655 [Geoglossum simile]